jgi:hypothetical protein
LWWIFLKNSASLPDGFELAIFDSIVDPKVAHCYWLGDVGFEWFCEMLMLRWNC